MTRVRRYLGSFLYASEMKGPLLSSMIFTRGEPRVSEISALSIMISRFITRFSHALIKTLIENYALSSKMWRA